jgi:hypothetical protein
MVKYLEIMKGRNMRGKNILLGLGFEAKDKHTRITRGKNFYIFGGSKPTHESMQESCIKFNEELDKRCKGLDAISPKEFYDIAHKIGLKVPEQKLKEEK